MHAHMQLLAIEGLRVHVDNTMDGLNGSQPVFGQALPQMQGTVGRRFLDIDSSLWTRPSLFRRYPQPLIDSRESVSLSLPLFAPHSPHQ